MHLSNYQISEILNNEYGYQATAQQLPEDVENMSYYDMLSYMSDVVAQLEGDEIEFGGSYYSCSVGSRLILLAEACNLAAKCFNDAYYEHKHRLICLAIINGVFSWENTDEYGDTVYYLYTPEVGTASFHDPYNECWWIVQRDFPRFNLRKFEWSGIIRQDLAFDLLSDDQMLSHMAVLTRPRNSYYGIYDDWDYNDD